MSIWAHLVAFAAFLQLFNCEKHESSSYFMAEPAILYAPNGNNDAKWPRLSAKLEKNVKIAARSKKGTNKAITVQILSKATVLRPKYVKSATGFHI